MDEEDFQVSDEDDDYVETDPTKLKVLRNNQPPSLASSSLSFFLFGCTARKSKESEGGIFHLPITH